MGAVPRKFQNSNSPVIVFIVLVAQRHTEQQKMRLIEFLSLRGGVRACTLERLPYKTLTSVRGHSSVAAASIIFLRLFVCV